MILEGKSGNRVDANPAGEMFVDGDQWRKAMERGDAFVWDSLDKDIDTTDTLLAVRNDHPSRDLVIEKIVCQAGDVACIYQIHLVTAIYTAAGTGVIGTPLNTNLATPAKATAFSDETGNTQGIIIAQPSLLITTTYTLGGGVNGPVCILGSDHAIGIDQVGESTAGSVQVFGYFKDRSE